MIPTLGVVCLVLLCDYVQADGDAQVVTFYGDEYLYYQFAEDVLVYDRELVELQFKTKYGDGLLFYTGDGTHFINIGLVQGTVYISTYNGGGRDAELKFPAGNTTRLDDNQWHSIRITREIIKLDAVGLCKISALVDNSHSMVWSLVGNFSNFNSRELRVGGTEDFSTLSGTQSVQNFFGCLKNVILEADEIVTLNILDGSSLYIQSGDIKYGECVEMAGLPPVTLVKPEHYLTFSTPKDTRNNFISLSFSTRARDGLILYTTGHWNDTFAVEMVDGYLYIILQNGEVSKRSKLSNVRANDGLLHSIVITMRPWGATVEVTVRHYAGTDGIPRSVTIGKKAEALKLNSPLYIGGVDYAHPYIYINSKVYTATMRKGFTGCLTDVNVDSSLKDLRAIARSQNIPVVNNCSASTGVCDKPICEYKDDADKTLMVRFNGSQVLYAYPPPPVSRSLAEELTVRFKTTYFTGTVFVTENRGNVDSLQVLMHNGKVIVSYHIASYTTLLDVEQQVNDNSWQVLRVRRIDNTLTADINDEEPITTTLNQGGRIPGMLLVEKIWLGSHKSPMKFSNLLRPQIANLSTMPFFIGHVSSLVYNGVQYLNIASDGTPAGNNSYTCDLTSDELSPLNVVSVVRPAIAVPIIEDLPFTNFVLQFKSRENSGLLLYGQSEEGYLVVELVQGRVDLAYGHKGAKERQIKIRNTTRSYGDDKWHTVSLSVLPDNNVIFGVDGHRYATVLLPDRVNVLLKKLYVAGAPSYYTALPEQLMQSADGFNGCLASVEINGLRVNLLDYADNYPLTKPGCPGKSNCSMKSCYNGGQCKQLDDYSLVCQCDMTTYTGPSCSQEPEVYMFGAEPQVINYTLPHPVDRYEDTIAFRLSTTQVKADILEIASLSVYNEYIKLEMRDGKIIVKYDLGEGKYIISFLNPINDGKYHIIKIWRNGRDIKADVGGEDRDYSPPDAKLKVFNSQAHILIGSCQRDKSFHGNITGLVINGSNIFSEIDRIYPDSCMAPTTRRLGKTSRPAVAEEVVIMDSSGDGSCDEPCTPPSSPPSMEDDIIVTKVIEGSATNAKRLSTKATAKSTSSTTTITDYYGTKSSPASPLTITADPDPNKAVGMGHAVSTADPNSSFDIAKNIPLMAGIAGAALITLILIAIIACRLISKPTPPTNKHSHNGVTTQPKQNTEQYANDADMNSSYSNGQTHPSKEWYV